MTECNTLANRHVSNPCESKNAHKNERDKERNNEFNSMLVVARAKNRVGRGTTCAKVILFGEHSVVYGYSAVALPLQNLKMHATVTSARALNDTNTSADEGKRAELCDSAEDLSCQMQNLITFKALGFDGLLRSAPARFASIKTAIQEALRFANWQGEALQIETACDFPPERGLGSSAAAAGAVIRAILDYYSINASDEKLFEITQDAERVAHGKASGLDATATSAMLQQPVRFLDGKFSRMSISPIIRAWIVLADSGFKGTTKVTVEALRKKRDSQPKIVNALLQELGQIALNAENDLEFGNIQNIGSSMTRAHKILAELGVSTPFLDALVKNACENGALGAKLTGGGGGGCIIAIAQSQEDASKVSIALKNAGAARTWIVEIGQ